MTPSIRFLTLSLGLFIGSLAPAFSQTLYFPPTLGNTWDTLAPGDLNYCQDSIDALYQYLDQEQTFSFMLLKDGKIVLEQYFGNYTQNSLWPWFSAGKSLRATLVGIAQEEGALDIHDKTSDYLGTGWSALPPSQEDSITVWHQLTMTAGLDETDFDCITPSCLTYVADAGTRWAYHNGPYNLTKEVLQAATGDSLNSYTRQKISNPIGIRLLSSWVKSGNNTIFWGTARDMARFGLLTQGGGIWDGDTILADPAYYNQMVNTSQPLNPSYGYLWWLNGKSSYIEPSSPLSIPGPIAPDAPADVFAAAGANGQFISISPSTGLVMVRQGNTPVTNLAPLNLHNEIWKRIMRLECVTTDVAASAVPQVRLYPQPATDVLRVDGVSAEGLQVQLFDLKGQRLGQWSETTELRLDGIGPGLYLIHLESAGQTFTHKVLLQ